MCIVHWWIQDIVWDRGCGAHVDCAETEVNISICSKVGKYYMITCILCLGGSRILFGTGGAHVDCAETEINSVI